MEDGSSFSRNSDEESEEEGYNSQTGRTGLPSRSARPNSIPDSQQMANSANHMIWDDENSSQGWEETREKLEREEKNKKEIGVVEMVKKMVDEFIVRGTNSPMQWMLDLRKEEHDERKSNRHSGERARSTPT